MPDRLPTFDQLKQTKTNWLPTTRKSQMVWLATLTAITLTGQYVMLGTFGLGRSLTDLADWFFIAEKILWGLRALVEIAVVVYVGMTQTDDQQKNRKLWTFEIILIVLIVATVGPVWIAAALNLSVVETVTTGGVYAWGAGLAGISATMLAAVAYAYKVQPVNGDTVVVTLEQYEAMESVVETALTKVDDANDRAGAALADRDRAIAERDGIMAAHAIFSLLSSSQLVRVAAMLNKGQVQPQTLANAFGLSDSTIRGVLAELRKDGIIS